MDHKNTGPLRVTIDRRGFLKILVSSAAGLFTTISFRELLKRPTSETSVILTVDGGYIQAGPDFEWVLPTRREYFDPESDLSALDFDERLEWVQSEISWNLDIEDLKARWADPTELDTWLNEEISPLDEGSEGMSSRDLAFSSSYGPGLELYEELGDSIADSLGLRWVDGDAPGRDFLGVTFHGNLKELNAELARRGLYISILEG